MRSILCFLAVFLCIIHAGLGKPSATSDAPRTARPATTAASPTAPAPLGKVLFVGVVGSRSHKNFYYGIIEALSNAGYEVTVLTPYSPSKKLKNVKEVVFERNDMSSYTGNSFKENPLLRFFHVMTTGVELCFNALSSDEYSEVLQEKFDIVFLSLFFNDCFLGHINALNAPFVLVSPAELFGPFSSSIIGSPSFPSFDYNPIFSFPQPMSFSHRFISTTSALLLTGLTKYVAYRVDSKLREEGLLQPDTPYLPSIYANASLMIGNSFRMAEHPRPYTPNVLLAGGIHLKPPQPLPKDLEDWVQSSGDAGFIFFSLGSAVRPSDLAFETIEVLLNVFKSLKQNVLWKFNLPDVGAELPPNVRLTTWAPQQDLLGHPKIRLFITHGGVLSTQEATFHGVPVIGIPVFGDQEGNMNKAESQGWGVKLGWGEITYDRLRSVILRLLDDPVARQKVSKIGELMRDRPTQPAADVVWWTGYILRTGGARHLKSGALPLTWYELYNVDVWASVAVLVLLALWADYKILKALYGCFCSRKAKNVPKKQKQQ